MSQVIEIGLTLPENTFRALKQAASLQHKTEAELVVEAIQAYLHPARTAASLLGLFTDKTELIDAIAEDVMQTRESAPMRMR
ncbi:MAG TPA: hypothetical protein VF429_07870 [Anaerolineae bacterium]|jgi:hypothetical protein